MVVRDETPSEGRRRAPDDPPLVEPEIETTTPGAGHHWTGTSIEVKAVDAAHGVIVTVSGPLGSEHASDLAELLAEELDKRPTVVVVDLSAVPTCGPEGVEVLRSAQDRALGEDTAIHLVHLGASAARSWLTRAGLR